MPSPLSTWRAAGAAAAAVVGGGTLAASFRCGATLLAFYFSGSRLTAWNEEQKATDDAFKAGGQRDWVQVSFILGATWLSEAGSAKLGPYPRNADAASPHESAGTLACAGRPLSTASPEHSRRGSLAEALRKCEFKMVKRTARVCCLALLGGRGAGAGQCADTAAGGAGPGAGHGRRGRASDSRQLPEGRPPVGCLPG